MSEEIKKQQTLFRFVSLRAPEKSKGENSDKRFVFHPDKSQGTFFSATVETWDDLQTVATNFGTSANVLNSEEEVIAIAQTFFNVSEWLAINKSTITPEEVFEKVKTFTPLDLNTIEIKLWDNLFYQVITRKNFYVKEAVIQMLVLQNLVKHKDNDTTLSDTYKEDIKSLIHAKVVLPTELFHLLPAASEGDGGDGGGPIEIPKPSKKLQDITNAEIGRIKAKNIEIILEALDVINKEHKRIYQAQYQGVKKAYEAKIKPINETYQSAYDTEFRRLYAESKDVEDVKRTIDVPKPEIPEFIFNYPTEPKIKSLSRLLKTKTYSYLTQIINISEIRTFSNLIDNLKHQLITEQNKSVSYQDLTEKTIVIGDAHIPVRTADSDELEYSLTTIVDLEEQDEVPTVFMKIILPSNIDLSVRSINFVVDTMDSGLKSSTGFTQIKSSGHLTLVNLLKDLDLLSLTLVDLNGEITFDNNDVYNFGIQPFSLSESGTEVYEGTLELEENGGGDSGGGDSSTNISNKFGYRQLGIADYKKVVSEVCCYKVGEVAHIENVMARELREKITTKFHQRQVIETVSDEIETERISDTISSERFEMQSEILKLLQEQKQFDANTSIHAPGVVTLNASAGYASNTSKEESNIQAVQQAKELTERATERVVSRSRKEKTTTSTTEYTEENKHRFDNTHGDEHVSGVFRFVNAIYKNQIHNYGKRLMYEFMIPQPSKLHNLAMTRSVEANPNSITLEKPVDPRTIYKNFTEINKNNYQQLVATYRASIEQYPDETVYVNQSFSGAKADANELHEGSKEIQIPENYYTANAKLKLNCLYDGNSSNPHGASISFADIRLFSNLKRNITETDLVGQKTIYVLNEHTNSLSISYSIINYLTFSFSLSVECKLSPSGIAEWQKNTYEAIIEGYEEQLRIYEEKKEAAKSNGIEILESNPLFYREIEKNVLRTICVSYLLDHQNEDSSRQFGKTMYNEDPTFTNYQIKQSEELDAYASFAKFMEQAFEWDLMSYHLYPYYWGSKNDWSNLYQFESNDPIFRNFMQSGMARVVVTVKPGFENAIMYYMTTGQIWNGGQMPVLGDPMYLSIIDELAEQAYKVEESWETILPTNLIALQKSGVAVDATGLPCSTDCDDGDSDLIDNSSDLGVPPA